MILVLSLNSAIDKTYLVPELHRGRLHRPETATALAGGKGLNVARVLTHLKEDVKVLGCVAGHNGRFIREAAAAEGIAAEWIEVKGESRLCLAVVDGKGGAPTELNEGGPRFLKADLQRFKRRALALLSKASALVCSGSLPPGASDDFYAQLIRAANARGIETALDTSGPALLAGLKAAPAIVKPNEEEARLLGRRGPCATREGLENLLSHGVRLAVITLGPGGLIAAENGHYYEVKIPKLKAVDPIGSGDSFLAGLLAARRRGWPTERSLRFAASIAAANTLKLGAGLFTDTARRHIEPLIKVHRN